MVMMRDVAIAKSEFKPGERAVTKLQELQHDDVLFGYCTLPKVSCLNCTLHSLRHRIFGCTVFLLYISI